MTNVVHHMYIYILVLRFSKVCLIDLYSRRAIDIRENSPPVMSCNRRRMRLYNVQTAIYIYDSNDIYY